MCLALGFPRCAFNRLTEQVMGARGDLAGSLQPGGLVMCAADREAPIRTSAGLVTAWMGSSSWCHLGRFSLSGFVPTPAFASLVYWQVT